MHSMQLGQQTCRSNGHSSAQPCTFARPVQTAWHRTCLANTLHQCHNTVRKDERSAATAYCTNKLRIRHYVKLEPTVGFIIEVLKGSDANGIAALVALEKRIFTKSDSWAGEAEAIACKHSLRGKQRVHVYGLSKHAFLLRRDDRERSEEAELFGPCC